MVSSPTAEEQNLAAAHLEYLYDLRDRGILILAGRTKAVALQDASRVTHPFWSAAIVPTQT